MSKPKHRRCRDCGAVTARYSHTQNAGAFAVVVWITDPGNGEVLRRNGTEVLCNAHSDDPARRAQ